MHKFVVSKSWWNCNWLVYTPNFESLIWKSFYKLFKSHIADIALRRYSYWGGGIIRKEIWLYFSNLLRKWKFTMKENSSNPNVFCTFKCIRRVLIEMTNNATRWCRNLKDFLWTTTTIFDNPRKLCDKMFFAKLIRIV